MGAYTEEKLIEYILEVLLTNGFSATESAELELDSLNRALLILGVSQKLSLDLSAFAYTDEVFKTPQTIAAFLKKELSK